VERDPRGSEPPAGEHPERPPDDGEGSEGEHGPAGNPAVDEEALSHGQQERSGAEGEDDRPEEAGETRPFG
jgi:hypothetical protein